MSAELFELRPGRHEDSISVAAVNVQGWRSAFEGILPSEFLDSLSIQGRSNALVARFEDPNYSLVVAETRTGEIVGFVDFGPSREEKWMAMCEVYAIYVLPSFQGLGVGRALLSGVVESKMDTFLSVLAVNPNVGFYTHMGGKELERGSVSIAGLSYETIYFGWMRSTCIPTEAA